MRNRMAPALFALLILQGCIPFKGSRPLPEPIDWADQIRKAALLNRMFADAISFSLDLEPPPLTVAQAEPLVEATEAITVAIKRTDASWRKWREGKITKRDFLRDFAAALVEMAKLRDFSVPLQLAVADLVLGDVTELENKVKWALQLEEMQ